MRLLKTVADLVNNNNRITPFFLLIFLLFSAGASSAQERFDRKKQLTVNLQYGHSNSFSSSDEGNGADESYFNELMLVVEHNLYKKFGTGLMFNYIQNREKGYGACGGPGSYYYDLTENAYLGSAYLYLNLKYFGFKIGLLGFTRDRGFCEEGAPLKGIYPAVDIKLGLINRLYLIVSGPQDLQTPLISYGIKYHFKDYYSQIYAGIMDAGEGLYILKTQLLLFDKLLVSAGGIVVFPIYLYSFRIGAGYVFDLAGSSQ